MPQPTRKWKTLPPDPTGLLPQQFGELLLTWRRRQSPVVRQEELATLIGSSTAAITRWEKGQVQLSPKTEPGRTYMLLCSGQFDLLKVEAQAALQEAQDRVLLLDRLEPPKAVPGPPEPIPAASE